MAWGKAGSTTLTGAGDDLDITSMTANTFNQFMIHTISSGQTNNTMHLNNDTGSNYAYRYSDNGGTDGSAGGQTFWDSDTGLPTADDFKFGYFVKVSGEETLGMSWEINPTTAGAGTAPSRREWICKYVPSPDADITRIDWNNAGSGDFAIGSNLSALGSDLTPTSAVTFPTNVQVGSRAEITDTRKIYYYSYDWFELGTTLPFTRGIFGGGGGSSTIMDYITIATTGNATDFGDLTVGRGSPAGVSTNTRGVFCGGHGGGYKNTCDYVTISTPSNATDFGDLTSARQIAAGVESDTRGVLAGGDLSTNIIDYITIATPSNATDFGDLTVARYGAAGVSSTTRGVFCGGDGTSDNVMDYITIATTGNATDFGNLTVSRFTVAGVENDTRGCISSGYDGTTMQNVIDYITITTTGNATDFGDMTVARQYIGGLNSKTRGVFGGGTTGSVTDVMDYITIATTGNATDFGDLTVARSGITGVQGS